MFYDVKMVTDHWPSVSSRVSRFNHSTQLCISRLHAHTHRKLTLHTSVPWHSPRQNSRRGFITRQFISTGSVFSTVNSDSVLIQSLELEESISFRSESKVESSLVFFARQKSACLRFGMTLKNASFQLLLSVNRRRISKTAK